MQGYEREANRDEDFRDLITAISMKGNEWEIRKDKNSTDPVESVSIERKKDIRK